jgi:hypothetical protein
MNTVNVAAEVCGDLKPLIPVNIDCSMCAWGWPQKGGRVQIQFFGPICAPSTSPGLSHWIQNPSQVQMLCLNPGDSAEPEANKWAGVGYFAGVSVNGNSMQYMWRAEMVPSGNDGATVSVTVWALTAGGVWKGYASASQTLTEVKSVPPDTSVMRSRPFNSGYVPITVSEEGGKGDIKYIQIIAGSEPMLVGCGGSGNADPICGMFDGSRFITCLRAHVEASGNLPVFHQMGRNPDPCGRVGQNYCWCDRITLNRTGAHKVVVNTLQSQQFATEYGFIGTDPANIPYDVEQQLQIGAGLVFKKIGSLLVAGYKNGSGNWETATPSVVDSGHPYVYRAVFPSATVTYYALKFPSPSILPEACGGSPVRILPNPSPSPPPPTPAELRRVTIPCIHLGDNIEDPATCGCGNAVLRKCAIHGQCRRTGYPKAGEQICLTCPSYQAP